MNLHYQPIGFVHSPYKQKFAIPRQSNLVPEAIGEIVFEPDFSDPHSLHGIDQFSHLWLLFQFHATAEQGWSSMVQPPRLGGKEKVGVFATRSPFRPNPIGISVVKNLGYETSAGKLRINVGGLDLLHGTPILDIKPYLPYADCLVDATGGYAEQAPGGLLAVVFSAEAEQRLCELETLYPQLGRFITSVLKQDPRPAWRVKEHDTKQYGMTIYDLNIKWRVEAATILVQSIHSIES